MKKIVSNLVEQEILILSAACHTLREMHNRIMIAFYGDLRTGQSMRFESSIARDLYFILLADFLANMREEYRCDKKRVSILGGLLEIIDRPLLGTKSSSRSLRRDLNKFKRWLDHTAVIRKMWFPNIEREINLRISRSDMIRICGNLNKHDFLKLSQLICVIQQIFIKNGVSLTEEEAIMTLEHFQEWFNENILIYHSSYIAEMLINVQWSIKEYLTPLYEISLINYYNEKLRMPSYRFVPPKELGIKEGTFIHHMYWELMNRMRDNPIFDKVVTSKYLKMRY